MKLEVVSGYRYLLHGVPVESNIAISGLQPNKSEVEKKAIEIRIDAPEPHDGQWSTDPGETPMPWLGDRPHIILRSSSIRHGLLAGCSASGDRISIRWWSSRPEGLAGFDRILTSYLLGKLVGMALCVQGQCVLHGNAARIGDRSIVWLGDKGAGKSTLSAAFLDAGYELITDDQVVLYPDGAGWRPGYGVPRIRLWPDSLGHASANTLAVYQQPFGENVKGWVETDVSKRAEMTGPPVAAICRLEPRHAASAEVRITRLSPVRCLQTLHRHRLARLALPLSPARFHVEFASLARLAAAVPVYSVQLPDDLRFLPTAVEQLACRFSPAVAA